MAILLSFVATVGITIFVAAVIRYKRTTFTAPVALSEEQQAACARILDSGLGRAWVCRKALEDGECTCIPCHNLDKEMKGELALTAPLRR